MPLAARFAGTLSAAHNESTPKTVSFSHNGDAIVGHLYLPDNYDSRHRYPAVAIGGSFTSVKEMMAGTYAGEMARRGIIGLAIDYRNYGQSDGLIRQFEDPESKSADLSAALEFLSKRPDVSGTGLLGVCTSGGTVLYPAASDARVGALATVVGFFQSPEVLPLLQGGENGVAQKRAEGQRALEVFKTTGEIEYIAAYSGPEGKSANPGSRPYYNESTRGGVPAWRNEFAVASWPGWLDWNPVAQAGSVNVPTLMVHSEDAAFPNQARAVYEKLGPQKEIWWTTGGHYDFYDDEETVHRAADKVAEHFIRHLS